MVKRFSFITCSIRRSNIFYLNVIPFKLYKNDFLNIVISITSPAKLFCFSLYFVLS